MRSREAYLCNHPSLCQPNSWGVEKPTYLSILPDVTLIAEVISVEWPTRPLVLPAVHPSAQTRVAPMSGPIRYRKSDVSRWCNILRDLISDVWCQSNVVKWTGILYQNLVGAPSPSMSLNKISEKIVDKLCFLFFSPILHYYLIQQGKVQPQTVVFLILLLLALS